MDAPSALYPCRGAKLPPRACAPILRSLTYSGLGWTCQGWTGGPGSGNIGEDPRFADADGADNVAGTDDDNLRLLPGSPCIDAGDNMVVPSAAAVDLDGNPRFLDDPLAPDTGHGKPPIVDMGAYEFRRAESMVRFAIRPEGGGSPVAVGPGGSVTYRLEVSVPDAGCDGLALFAVDLLTDTGEVQSPGQLEPDTVAPCFDVFASSGTPRGDDLLDVAGAQDVFGVALS